MKKLCWIFLTVFAFTGLSAQTSGDKELDARVAKYMQLTLDVNYKDLVEYVHPSLFKIVPKADFIEVFQKAFESEEMSIGFDSMAVISYSPSFLNNGSDYKEIKYRMRMYMIFKDSSVERDSDFHDLFILSLKGGFDDADISYNEKRKSYMVLTQGVMIAIKDKDAPWMFLGIEKSNPVLMNALFPEAVIKHFKLL
jgi:hypothetical protein